MTIFITGATGFVAHHFLRLLVAKKLPIKVVGVYHTTAPVHTYLGLNIRWEQAQLADKKVVQQLIQKHNPTHILHLAAQSSVANSWQQPYETYQSNTIITLNILEAMRLTDSKARLLIAGSAEVYATSTHPIAENSELAMSNIYAVSKYAQEQLADRYVKQYQLHIVCTRAFNHIGPMQNNNFVIPSFAHQIVQQIKQGNKEIALSVGNTAIIRDFTDVRDIVLAFDALLCGNPKHFIYNLSSGKGCSIQDIIKTMENAVQKPIITTVDANKIRPIDNPIMIGDATRMQQEFNWTPTINMAQTIKDIFTSLGLLTK
jgi:GDP-4-dehydro-6-deoxy-D-mannose reductase